MNIADLLTFIFLVGIVLGFTLWNKYIVIGTVVLYLCVVAYAFIRDIK